MGKGLDECMRDVLMDYGGTEVWYGSVDYIMECVKRAELDLGKEGNRHPLRLVNKVFKELEKSDYFEKSDIRENGEVTTVFKLIH